VQDDGEMPCSFWGRLKKSVAFGSKLSCLVETSTKDFHHLSVDLRATKDSASLQVTGSITVEEQTKATTSKSKSKIQQARQASFEVQSVKLSQSIRDPLVGGRLSVTPRYNILKNEADITTSYGLAGTFVTLDANAEKRKLSIRQEILGGSIKPSLDTNGKVEVQFTRPFGGAAGGSLTASYKHDDSVGLMYEQGSLVATVVAPPVQQLISLSCKPQDLKFSIRKAVYLTD
jgi:hypothetical protein